MCHVRASFLLQGEGREIIEQNENDGWGTTVPGKEGKRFCYSFLLEQEEWQGMLNVPKQYQGC